MFKSIVFAQALLIQVMISHCIGHPHCAPTPPCDCTHDCYPTSINFIPSSSSSNYFPVTSSSPIAPNSLTITSENTIQGPLSVFGELPFLSAVEFGDVLPTSGYGTVAYSCGGNPGIYGENYGQSQGQGQAHGYAHNGYSHNGYAGSYSGLAEGYTGLSVSPRCGSNGSPLPRPRYTGTAGCGCQ